MADEEAEVERVAEVQLAKAGRFGPRRALCDVRGEDWEAGSRPLVKLGEADLQQSLAGMIAVVKALEH